MNPHLVDITSKIPDAILDIRYATNNNITGSKLYDKPLALLPPEILDKLVNAANEFRQKGYRIVIFDAWRPIEAQKKLREVCHDDRYVAEISNHCRGVTVDITLADKNGNYLDMGTDYDDFSEKAHIKTDKITQKQKENRKLLRNTMQRLGFAPYPYEWWHFDYLSLDHKVSSQV